jgi:hypothetical protein
MGKLVWPGVCGVELISEQKSPYELYDKANAQYSPARATYRVAVCGVYVGGCLDARPIVLHRA